MPTANTCPDGPKKHASGASLDAESLLFSKNSMYYKNLHFPKEIK